MAATPIPPAAGPQHAAPLTSVTLVAQGPLAPAARRTDTDTVAMKSELPRQSDTTTPADRGDERHPTGLVMLLAAVGLMTGIALRRRGAGPQ